MTNLSYLRHAFRFRRVMMCAVISAFIVSPANAENIYGILKAHNYHQVFEYNFNQNSKPSDFDGSTIWDQNLWYGTKFNAPDEMKLYPDHVSLLTPAGDHEKTAGNSLTTWSKSSAKPLVKFHYGYFEARMRYNWSSNQFPAFWLESTKRPLLGGGGKVIGDWCEIDIFEGGQKNVYNGTVHDWHDGVSTENQNQHAHMANAVDYSQWNDYGALWDPQFIHFYFNGVEVSSTPTPEVCKNQDAFIVIGSQTRNQKAERTQVDIQRVRVWQYH